MITVASHPTDLAAWDQDKNPYYSEVLGEAEPVLDMTHATVLPPGGPTVQSTTSTPVYEYWWTMGHGGAKPERVITSSRAARSSTSGTTSRTSPPG